jgi:hypothetical protein
VKKVDVVIFGAGPAGLAAAFRAQYESRSFVVLELGHRPAKRGRYTPQDLVTGIGGAGLYSDGKLSFFPSATALWQLENESMLRTAYDWLEHILADFTTIPSFPHLGSSSARVRRRTDKRYPTRSISFDDRVEIIRRLKAPLDDWLLSGAKVEEMSMEGDFVSVVFRRKGKVHRVLARSAIVACGRFGGLELSRIAPWLPTTFRRYEFGVRIEAPSTLFPLESHPSVDPKFILRCATPQRSTDLAPASVVGLQRLGLEWRTFCTCRSGEVIRTEFEGIQSLSGRSDVEPTAFSNMGFNVRITKEPDPSSKLSAAVDSVLSGKVEHFSTDYSNFMSKDFVGYGEPLDDLIRYGFGQLGLPVDEAIISGPCIEGIGHYPHINSNSLRVADYPIWIGGDQTGVFRGLTAAFVSGHYAAQDASRYLTETASRHGRRPAPEKPKRTSSNVKVAS